ncbi:MAG TPA: energy-coupling factor transporter ATPase [Bacillota bacterium]|nr:energy-coupling factor transporter ATPase [Clostridiales bacterium]HPT84628.1 energy-coupling factor transporter ATPase [Bacillota bacterium]
MSGTPFIKAENLCFSYSIAEDGGLRRELPVIKNVSFEIGRGDFVAILGHNGSGKSTLAKLLNLILTPTSGKIYIDGRDITDPAITEDDIFEIRRKIGMVFQNPDNQLVATVVEEDVAFGPENLGIPPEEIRRRVNEALAIVGMSAYARHSPHQLSGGQKQRVAIAGIIAMLPECIVFDESTSMLDPSGRKEVMNTIVSLNRDRGITVLHITHNMDEAVLADRVIVINDGEIFLDGTPREVFSHVGELQSVGLDVPQVTELLYELSVDGIKMPDGSPLPRGVLSEEEGAEILRALL